MGEKIVIGLASALLSGALSWGLSSANTAGRLESVERTLVRIESRLDNLAKKEK